MTVRFLADESCDFGVVKALRAAGFEVAAVSETMPGAHDAKVVDKALREKMVLITEDKDFGQLVYASGHQSIGVLFLRYPYSLRKNLFDDTVRFAQKAGEDLIGAFCVIQPGRIRIRRLADIGNHR